MDAAKQPVSPVLAGPYGHPFHPILVTVPIGAWVSSLVFDVAAQVVSDPDFLVRGSRWLVVIGLVGAVAAACVGSLDLFAIPTGTPAFRTAVLHLALNSVVVLGYLGSFLWRANGSVGAGIIALDVVLLAVLGLSGFLGGKLAFRYGVRVADEATQATGFLRSK
ncbi:MAG: DUF2231 domain-containing protein [Nonomuraea sp.]|nr:DUF2231 domain-containing protein [Nonomuraea sp.]